MKHHSIVNSLYFRSQQVGVPILCSISYTQILFTFKTLPLSKWISFLAVEISKYPGFTIQSVRNKFDMNCLAWDFWQYYEGKKTAPVTTIFIGGNHEASNYLLDLYYGGWVAPQIYYLGYSGVVDWKGITIAGVSGIYKHYDYHKGFYESYPFTKDDLHTVYHYRAYEFEKLKCFGSFRRAQGSQNVEIFLSHEWPTQAPLHGDVKSLLKYKPYFQENIEAGCLGAPPLDGIAEVLRPKYWFSGHLHCHYRASIPTKEGDVINFTALDKPIPKRKYLEFYQCWYDEKGNLKLTPWDSVTAQSIQIAKGAQTEKQKEEESKEQPSELSYNSDYLATLHYFQEQLTDCLSNKPKLYPHPKYSSVLDKKNQITKKNLDMPSWGTDYRFQCLAGKEYQVHPFSQKVIDLSETDIRFFIPMLSRHQKQPEVVQENPQEMYLQF